MVVTLFPICHFDTDSSNLLPLFYRGKDKETDWSQVLLGVLWNSETDRKTGSVDRSILWRLWHYEETVV